MTIPLVIYHANCADGFASAFIAFKKFGSNADYVPMQYGNIKFLFETNEFLVKGKTFSILDRKVYVLDLSFDRDIMEALRTNASLVWLDHHLTAFDSLGILDTTAKYTEVSKNEIVLDITKSGALLTWEHFNTEDSPLLYQYIDDHDRYLFKLENSREINKAIWSYQPWRFNDWENFENNLANLAEEGRALIRVHDNNVNSIVIGAGRACEITLIRNNEKIVLKGLSANCPPHLSSDVGNSLAKSSSTFGLVWYINRENKCICSLRSTGSYNVKEIAAYFQGGGHLNAAGFSVPVNRLLSWIK